MEKTENKGIASPLKSLEKNKEIQLKAKSDPFTSFKYKQYFKSFTKYNKNN